MIQIRKIALSLTFAFLIALTSIFLQTTEVEAALVFHSGFESGNTFEWSSTSGTVSIQSTIKYTGSYAARFNPVASFSYLFNLSVVTARFTSYLYIAAAPDKESLIEGNQSRTSIRLTPNRYLTLYSGSNLVATGTTQLLTGQWTRVSGSIDSSNKAYVWIDGNIELSGQNVGYSVWGDGSYAFNLGVSYPLDVTMDLYADDVTMDNTNSTADLGNIRILLSLPNAAGDLTEFDTTVGSTTHWQNVDDAPGSSYDTDYNQHAAATNKADLYNSQDSSTIGVGVSDTINAVRSLYRMQRSTGAAAVHQSLVKDNGTEYNTTLALTTAFAWYSRYDATMPNGGATWTQTRFDAFQGGARHADTGAQDTFISALMVMVAFTPAGGTPAITVSPITYNFGVIAESTTPSTTTSYFTIDNTSTMQTDQTVSVTTATWSGGVTWTHSDTATAGANTAGLKANKGGTWGTGDVIVKYNATWNDIATNQPANTDYSFGLKLIAPTSFTDGVQKEIKVRITAAAG